MIDPISALHQDAIPLLIPSKARDLAQEFASQQPTRDQAKQVYLNTLAVCLVNNYLRIMGIPTDLNAGDSWNPAVRLFADVADLRVVGRGRLECRPVQRGTASVCHVPAEVHTDRIAYVVVELDEVTAAPGACIPENCDLKHQQAHLLGFVPTVESEVLPLKQLRSPDEFLEHLLCPQPQTVNLRQWLQHTIDAGWQTVESLLHPPEFSPVRGTGEATIESPDSINSVIRLLHPDQPEEIRTQAAGILADIGKGHPDAIFALTELLDTAETEESRWQAALSLAKLDPDHPEGGVKMAKAITLAGEQVVLLVAIMPKADDRIGVWLQVQPLTPHTTLPPGLKLSVLSGSGQTRLQVEARSDDQNRGLDQSIGRRFTPPSGTPFKVQLQLDSASVIEDFVV